MTKTPETQEMTNIDGSPARQRQVLRKVLLRIGLFGALCNIMNNIDRANVSYAALVMNTDLGLDARAFGFGAGLFFVSYVIFMMPIVHFATPFGVRRSLGLMLIVWGTLSSLMCLAYDAYSFFVLRFLLGAAEAAAAPIITFYVTKWVPQRAMSGFLFWLIVVVPISAIFVAPLSGWIMESFDDFAGFAGWRWLFIIEGAPTIMLGVWTLLKLWEDPPDATWLSPPERNWLIARIGEDSAGNADEAASQGPPRLMNVISDGHIWTMALAFFCIIGGVLALTFWLPQIIREYAMESGTLAITSMSAIPWIGLVVGLALFGRSSDQRNERRWHATAGALIGASGLVAAAHTESLWLVLTFFTIAGFGIGGAQVVFWTIPMGYLRGRPHAPLGFAFITLLGSSAGFVIQWLIGELHSISGRFSTSIDALAVIMLIGAILIYASGRPIQPRLKEVRLA